MSKTTGVDAHLRTDNGHFETEGITQIGCEYVYHKTGVRIEGVCEMRQKWYPSVLEPRSYYAMGGDAFHRSKYVSGLFEGLCDLFSPTNRVASVRPWRLRAQDGDHFLFYDLSSFTSNLHPHKYFLEDFADFCTGTNVRLFDGWQGLIDYDLGDLIREYATLYESIPIDVTRVYPNCPLVENPIASLLGIYGNIMSAKLIHGILMMCICKTDEEVNVVGDDGAIATHDDDAVLNVVRTMGEVQKSKCYSSQESGSIHLKRPVEQFYDRLIFGKLAIWPSFEYPDSDNDVDDRYPFIRTMSREDRRSSTCSTVVTFLNSISDMHLTDEHKCVIHTFLVQFYKDRGFPLQGNVPQITGGYFVASIEGDYIGRDPKVHTITRLWSGYATVTRRENLPFDNTMLASSVFECNSAPYLTYFKKMGYITCEKTVDLVYGEEGLDRLIEEYVTPGKPLYVWTILEPIPYVI